MKRIKYILCTLLLAAFAGCQEKPGQEEMKVIDLRYRAMDSYEVAAVNAQAFTIMVSSTDPWTVTSDHPDWCIISQEQGEGAPADSVRIGHAPITNVRVQYYDNLSLDDREDQITIQSEFWVGKVINVLQKGTAYLTISEEDLEQEVVKGGGEYTIHIGSNQNWTAKVTQGEWISITDGAAGSMDGNITLSAENNPKEKREAAITIYDRHEVARYVARFTQDGLLLDIAKTELRTDYNQTSVSVDITSNAKWTVAKASEQDDWFTIDTPSGEESGSIKLTLTENDEDAVRKAELVIKNTIATEDEYQATKTIVLKQAYHVTPKRYILDNDELSLWKADQANSPAYTKDVGALFVQPCRITRSDMALGTYTFRWNSITAAQEGNQTRVRHWFCFNTDPNDKDGEIKVDICPFEDGGKVSFSFNTAKDGNKPSVSSISLQEYDFTQPIEISVKIEPSGVVVEEENPDTMETTEKEYCMVSFGVNGEFTRSFETSYSLFRSGYRGVKFQMYFGMYNAAGSAICEWYEYTEPLEWD